MIKSIRYDRRKMAKVKGDCPAAVSVWRVGKVTARDNGKDLRGSDSIFDFAPACG